MRHLSDIAFNHQPLILPLGTTVRKVCESMREQRVGSALVVDHAGNLIGIFTGRDAVSRVLAAGKSARTTRIEAVMTRDPKTMAPDLSAIDALRLMWDYGFRHLPVCNEGRILGIVSRGDFKGYEKDRLEEEVNLWEHLR